MATRWAWTAFCSLAMAAAILLASVGVGAAATSARPTGTTPPLTLASQTALVTPNQPWFNIALAVGSAEGPVGALHVSLTFYGRVIDQSQFEQAVSALPAGSVLRSLPGIAVTKSKTGGEALACVTVLPDDAASAPTTGTGACPADSPTVVLGCTPDIASCGDVYPVSVALLRQGSTVPVERFTTFLTYEEPLGPIGNDGPLRVSIIAPISGAGAPKMVDALAAHHEVPITLGVVPQTVSALQHDPMGHRVLTQLANLSSDEVPAEPYVPVSVAALSEAGIANEIGIQVAQGTELLQKVGLRPTGGPWVDTASTLSEGDAANLASGLRAAGASQLVVTDSDLATAGSSSLTFAQPFMLDLGHGSSIAAAASNSYLSALFTATPGDPVLGAEQLLAGLSFVHYENTFKPDHRGVIVSPRPNWQPSAAFLETFLSGLDQSQVLTPVTLNQFFAQVPIGGNGEPSTARLQPGSAGHGVTRSAALRIATARQQLSSWCCGQTAAVGKPTAGLTTLADELLSTESQRLSPAQRSSALNTYEAAFGRQTETITLATERTVTFTASVLPSLLPCCRLSPTRCASWSR